MKRKLALLFLTAVSCACLTVGLAACGESGSAHTMTYHAATAATCTKEGNSAYYYCSDCEKYFSDANGENEIELSSTVTSALGHNYEIEFTWTKTDDGYTAAAAPTCIRCGETGESVEAEVVLTSQKEATCTEDGEVVYTATAIVDGETETDTKTLVDPATGHTYSEDWSYDDDYHWHAAICEHTDEVSDYATHSYAKDADTGNYVCSVCGKTGTDIITSASDGIAVGVNYISLGDSDSSIDDITFTAAESGEYTFTLSSDCQAQIRLSDVYSTLTYIGRASGSDDIYTASFELAAGESLTIDYITAGEGCTFDSEYIFCLNITYTEKVIAQTGTEGKPYAFTNPDNYGGESTTATLAAGESYYFTVTSDSDTLSQITFSNSDSSSFELYVNGSKVDYETYTFSAGSTATTFCLTNVSSGELSNTIHCAEYEPSLSTSENEVVVTSAMLNSSNSVTYSVTISTSTSYTVTIGSGSDSNAAVYYTGYYGYDCNELIETSYTLTNTSTRGDRSFYITIVYTGDAIPASFTVYINFAEVQASEDEGGDAEATYTAITLDEAFTMNFNAASTYYFSYTPVTTSSNYTLVFTFTNTAFYSTLVGLVTVTVNGSTISGSAEKDGVYYVLSGASEYKINITLTGATLTLTGTLTSGGEVTETTVTELTSGDNTVYNSTLYSFTATTAGTYTFTVTNGGGYTVISSGESSSSSTVYFDEQESSESYFTLELTAGEAITLYISGGNDDGFTLTIS